MSESNCFYARDHGIVDECDYCGWFIEHDKESKEVGPTNPSIIASINMLNAWMRDNCHGGQ